MKAAFRRMSIRTCVTDFCVGSRFHGIAELSRAHDGKRSFNNLTRSISVLTSQEQISSDTGLGWRGEKSTRMRASISLSNEVSTRAQAVGAGGV